MTIHCFRRVAMGGGRPPKMAKKEGWGEREGGGGRKSAPPQRKSWLRACIVLPFSLLRFTLPLAGEITSEVNYHYQRLCALSICMLQIYTHARRHLYTRARAHTHTHAHAHTCTHTQYLTYTTPTPMCISCNSEKIDS